MRGVVMKTILAAAIAGSSLLVATGANAHDRWDKWDRWEHKHHWKHSRGYGPPQRVIVERPVYVAPARPVYVAPMAPMVPGLRLRRWRLPAGSQRELQLQLPALRPPRIMSGVWVAHDPSALRRSEAPPPLRHPPAKGRPSAGLTPGVCAVLWRPCCD